MSDESVELQPTPSPAPITSSVQMSADDGTKRANVILSAEKQDQALPKGLTNIGNIAVTLPDEANQIAGFYLEPELAATLIVQFRQYKFLVNKGQATPPVKIGE